MRREGRHRRALVDDDGTRFAVIDIMGAAETGVLAVSFAALVFAAHTLWPDADPVISLSLLIGMFVASVVAGRRHFRIRDVMITLAAAAGGVAAGFRLAGFTGASAEPWAVALAVLVAIPVGAHVGARLVARHERRMARPPL